jgi:hypothetical protein
MLLHNILLLIYIFIIPSNEELKNGLGRILAAVLQPCKLLSSLSTLFSSGLMSLIKGILTDKYGNVNKKIHTVYALFPHLVYKEQKIALAGASFFWYIRLK